MEKKKPDCHHPSCMLAHDLINKLSVIVGNCDLVLEQEKLTAPSSNRITHILKVANSMAEILQQHQCHLASMIRNSVEREERPS